MTSIPSWNEAVKDQVALKAGASSVTDPRDGGVVECPAAFPLGYRGKVLEGLGGREVVAADGLGVFI